MDIDNKKLKNSWQITFKYRSKSMKEWLLYRGKSFKI
jgi:hypothetical protein